MGNWVKSGVWDNHWMGGIHVDCGRWGSAPELIKLFSCSTQLSIKFTMLINVKMPTIADNLTYISMMHNI